MTLRELSRRAAVLPIRAYRAVVSPLLPPSCIYSPTCSSYAQAAILRHGVLAGTVLAVSRVARCAGGLFIGGDDPVPEVFSFRAVAEGYRKFRRRRGAPPASGTDMQDGSPRGTMGGGEGGASE